MKKILTLFSMIFAVAIFFYPITSTSLVAGSPGGKTNSPMDGQNCTGCHSGVLNAGSGWTSITTDIPTEGYTPGATYTITLEGTKQNISKFGFELTAESSSSKVGTFFITDPTTQLVNNNNSVTHKASGTSGTNTKTWDMDWSAPSTGSGDITFYGALNFCNNNLNNSGDVTFTSSTMVSEFSPLSIAEISNVEFSYNSIRKSINASTEINVYDISGKLMLSSSKKYTSLSNFSNGIYIIKSENNSQKILIN
jgi:hypothetical protein